VIAVHGITAELDSCLVMGDESSNLRRCEDALSQSIRELLK
jgi:hypothetical protein